MSARAEAPRTSDPWSVVRSSLSAFWLLLGVVLIGAVVLVASVAHTSMDKVGPSASQFEIQSRPKQATLRPAAAVQVIVQVSSHTSRAVAVAATRDLQLRHGIQGHVLESGRYRPLNRGYFVVYVGPYPPTAAGRAAAKRIQARIPGALVRDIRAR
jgi:hypothetical protein